MGVGAEDILVCVWRFLHFSMRTSSKCMQKYPSVSGTLLFLFILYAFFNLFVFFSPFLVCVALLLRVFWTSGGLTILDAKQDEKQRGDRKTCKNSGSVGDDVVVNRDGSSSLQKQKSRRTNVKRIDWDGQSEKEEKQASTLATSHVSRTILLGKEAKGLNMQEKERAFDHGESSNAKMSAAEAIQVVDEDHSILDSDRDILSSGSSDDESEKFEGGGSKEEAAKEDGNKAVQWTDDDQRNLMDLGLSEIERNKRLESLIARRRARKLFKMQIEKGLIDLDTILPGQIAPLYIARNNPFIAEMDGMQTPGSAPSVMFPAKNPFDLPYDPLEEKPDLKADSFQQEFTAVTQKDMLYCRHESFCYGAAFALDPKKRAIDELGFSRFRKQSNMGPHDKRIERMLSNKGEHDELVETLLAEVKENISRIDSISEVVDSEATTPNLQATTSGEAKDERSKERRSVINIQGMSKTKNDHNVDVMSTTSAHMEPHVTDDSNDESTSSGMSEEDEHEQTFTANRSEFSQNAASKVGRVPPKPLNCSLPSPSNERGRLEERLFYAERGPCHTPTYSIASDLQVEVSDIGSPPLTVDGANSPTDRESLNLDGDFEREYMWAASSQSSRTEENESKFRDVRGLSERDLAGMGFSRNSKNTKDVAESSMPFQQADELDDTYSLSSTMTGLQGDSRAHSMSFDNKAFDDVRQVVEEVGKPSTSGLSNELSPDQVQAMKSSEKLVAQPKESSNPPDETTKKVNVPAANMIDDLKDEKKNSNPSDSIKNSNPNQDGKAEKRTAQSEVSEEKQISKDPIPSAVQQNLAIQEFPSNSTSSSSPKSVLLEKVQRDQASSTDYTPTQQTDAPKEKPHDSSSSTPQNGMHLVEESTSRSSNTRDSEKSQEQCKPPEKSTEQANIIQKKSAEETRIVSQKGIEAAAELKKPVEEITKKAMDAVREVEKPAEEVGSVSQKATEAHAELKKPAEENGSLSQKAKEAAADLKNPNEEIGNVSQKAKEVAAELKKTTEESGNVSQEKAEAVAELKKSADKIENVKQKETEAAAESKKPVDEVGSVSQQVTKATPELKKTAEENVSVLQKAVEAPGELKQSAEEISISQKSAEAPAELKKSTEEVGSVSQKFTEVPAELKKSIEETASVSQKAAVAPPELKKSTEEVGSVSQKSTEVTTELKKSVEETASVSQKAAVAPPELKKSTEETGSVSQKSTEAPPAELKKSVEEIASVSQKAAEAPPNLKKSAKESGTVAKKEREVLPELKKSAEESGSVTQKETEAHADVRKSVEEIASVSQEATKAAQELKKPIEEIGSVSQKATEAPPAEVKDQAEEIGILLQKATETAAGLKNPAKETGSVSQNAIEATAEMKKPEEIGNVWQKEPDTTAELKRPAEVNGIVSQKEIEAPVEIRKTVEEIANVSQKVSEVVAELKSPAEKSENVSGKAKEVVAMLKSPAEETGNVSQKATEVAAEMKKTSEEIGNVAQKAKEAVTDLQKSAEEIGNVSQNTVEAHVELKKPVEEIGNVSQKTAEATAESKKPAEESVNNSHKATEPPAALQIPAEEIKT